MSQKSYEVRRLHYELLHPTYFYNATHECGAATPLQSIISQSIKRLSETLDSNLLIKILYHNIDEISSDQIINLKTLKRNVDF